MNKYVDWNTNLPKSEEERLMNLTRDDIKAIELLRDITPKTNKGKYFPIYRTGYIGGGHE